MVLDIYRDPPLLDPESAALANRWRGDRFIDICQVGDQVSHSPEILPPPGISLKQVGFSDLPKDPDLVIRRQIFGMSPGKPDQCYTDKSFSFQMARHYLTAKNIKFNRLSQNRFEIGTRVFQRVELHTGGYHNFEAGGFEVMLNYRTSEAIAPKVPLQEILNGSRDSDLPNLVRGRIVLIGTLDRSYGDDYHLTPYSEASQPRQEMPGVEIQGQMVSQILSAVLDKRAILWWLPQWGDALMGLGLVFRWWRNSLGFSFAPSLPNTGGNYCDRYFIWILLYCLVANGRLVASDSFSIGISYKWSNWRFYLG